MLRCNRAGTVGVVSGKWITAPRAAKWLAVPSGTSQLSLDLRKPALQPMYSIGSNEADEQQ